jgi:hypothetical protein
MQGHSTELIIFIAAPRRETKAEIYGLDVSTIVGGVPTS